ncbi:phage infection protein [Staphylococcus microti]|uniref:Membrane protein n=1 Tax=Staphylococcus microti TaxID=569857 RepID=A0A0D6XRJ1_9STAP|nr:YhgE/Pip domain-containing protein [Staphylococcus microti]KIX90438.1 phage infection protein [Staphylococcus microti]PNZ84720.1 YhgE/Pip domain-containing protein [Staphylococcus microti]SUM58457.1 membrane protein [Staphylococcus microti]
MKQAFKLFLTDLKRIGKAPGALILLAGLAILPSFYAWFNLEATWDPYSNTGNIKIAVVNEDEGDMVRDKKINVGNKIEETLHKDDHFDWQFVSREKADKGLYKGKYYAAMYIPKQFSHQITGTLRKDPQQAKVTYKVNQKLNAIAPKMTDAGTSEIVKKANESFDKAVTKVLLEEANRLGIEIEKQLPTYNKIRDGVDAAYKALPKIEKFRKAIIYIDENQGTIDNYADRFRHLGSYKDEAVTAAEKLNQLNASIPAINERAKLILKLNDYMPEIERALQVASGVPDHFPQINQGVDTAIAGTEKGLQTLDTASQVIPTIEQRINIYEQGIQQAQDINQGFADNLTQYQDQANTQPSQPTQPNLSQNGNLINGANVPQLNGNANQNNVQNQAQQGVNQALQNGLNQNQSNVQVTPQSTQGLQYKVVPLSTQMDSNMTPLPDGQVITADEATTMGKDYGNALQGVNDMMASQLEGTQQDLDAAKNISFGILSSNQPDTFTQPLSHLIARMNHTSKTLRDYRDWLAEIEQSEGVDLTAQQEQLKQTQAEIKAMTKRLNALQDAIASGNTGKAEAQDVIDALDALQQRLKGTSTTVKNDIANALLDVSKRVGAALDNGAATIDTVQDKLQTTKDIVRNGQVILSDANERLTQLRDVLPTIEAKYNHAMSIAQTYYPEFKRSVARAADFVRNDLPELEANIAKATNTVNAKLPEAFEKYDTLNALLDENQPKAKRALSNLADFARNDLPKVEQDLVKAEKVFNQLDEDNTIEDIIDLLRNDLRKQAGVIAKPIEIDQHNIFPVKDYGSASTPFYTALAIWVGTLLLVSLLSVHNKHEDLKPYLTIRETYLGKMGIFMMMSLIQSFIVSVGDIVILKASVESVPLFIAISLFSAMIFTIIVYTLVSVLGNPGKALAIIILVLQIAGGGGTFPIEVTPQFFQKLHPFLPFSYSIDALREAVGGPVPEILIHKLSMLGLFGVIFFLIGILGKPYLNPIVHRLAERAEKSNIFE